MKIEVDDLDEIYNSCRISGRFKEKIPDLELIKSLKDVAERGIRFIDSKSKDIPKESTDWTFVFRDYYESLRELIEAYLLFDGIEADSHQCKNAYLCFKHQELDLNWSFLETVRLKRNSINYQGIFLKYEDWKTLKFQFDLHIRALVKEIEKKMGES